MKDTFLESKISLKDLTLQPEDYFICEKEPNFLIKRKIFYLPSCEEYTIYEEKKYLEFQNIFLSDISLNRKILKYKFEFILREMVNNKPYCMRLLNIFNYEPDLVLKNFEKFTECLKKLKINNLFEKKNSNHLMTKSFKEESFLKFLERDNKLRPIFGVKFNRFFKEISISDIISYCNTLLDNYLINGIVEQVILVINLDNLNQSEFITNYNAFLIILQIIFSSKIHKIYMKVKSPTSHSAFLNINKFIFKDFRERFVFIDLENPQQLCNEIDIEIINNFLNNEKTSIENNMDKSNKYLKQAISPIHKNNKEEDYMKYIDIPNDNFNYSCEKENANESELFTKMKTADTCNLNLGKSILQTERFEMSLMKENLNLNLNHEKKEYKPSLITRTRIELLSKFEISNKQHTITSQKRHICKNNADCINDNKNPTIPMQEYIILMDNSVKNGSCCNFGGCIVF
jgi:hypothetical protein